MASRTIALIKPFSHVHGSRVRRRRGRIQNLRLNLREGRQASLPTKLEHNHPANIPHSARLQSDLAGSQRENPAPTRKYRQVLFAVDGIRNRRGNRASLYRERPNSRALVRKISFKIAVGGALENQI